MLACVVRPLWVCDRARWQVSDLPSTCATVMGVTAVLFCFVVQRQRFSGDDRCEQSRYAYTSIYIFCWRPMNGPSGCHVGPWRGAMISREIACHVGDGGNHWRRITHWYKCRWRIQNKCQSAAMHIKSPCISSQMDDRLWSDSWRHCWRKYIHLHSAAV
jgi:hypothetical protein